MESNITEELIKELSIAQYKNGVAKSILLVMECRNMCLDNSTQVLYAEILRKLRKEME